MKDKEFGKKEVERMELDSFLDAYKYSTGKALQLCLRSENPDFICKRENGEQIGIELTKVMRDPRDKFWDQIHFRKEEPDSYECLETITYLIKKKEKARNERYVNSVKDTILVLQIMDGSLDTIMPMIDGLEEDFKSYGFEEIWLADYSGLEAYGDIELFGLYPHEIYGFHQRPRPDRKPYG